MFENMYYCLLNMYQLVAVRIVRPYEIRSCDHVVDKIMLKQYKFNW